MDKNYLYPSINIKNFIHLIRANKPIGILLLIWPMLSALLIAGNGSPQVKNVIIFTLGAIVMRSFGCIINDYADIDFDKYVKRTKERPLTSNKISKIQAIIFGMFLLSLAYFLVLQLNIKTILLSFIALILAIIYPFMKRYTNYPQFILGLAFAMSIPMAFSAENNAINSSAAILLFTTTTLWAMVYDTEYAMVDQDDDIKIGIKSTAIYFDNYAALFIALLQIIILMLYVKLGLIMEFGRLYFANLTVSAIMFIRQQQLIKNKDPENCFKAFLNNNYFGFFIFFGILLEYLTC